MKLLIINIFLFVLFGNLSAEIAVKSFRKLESDMTARIDAPKKDQNGDVCAIIKVVTTQTGFVWEPDGLGIVNALTKVGEYWLYVPYGAKRLTIKHSQLGVLRDYIYPLPIEKACVYEMVLITGRVETIVVEEISKQWLLITPKPEKALIYIDDVFVATGEYQAQHPPGNYNYRVEAPLYHTEAGKFEITDSKKVIEVTLKPSFGFLNINSTPEAGARVIINGKELTKTTPATSEALASGEYTVQVVKEMYQPSIQKVIVSDNQTTPVNFTLTPNFAELNITAPQQASIVINGQQKGRGGWNGRLSAGIYTVEAQMDKHRVAKLDIPLAIGDKKEITLQPTPIYGAVDIVTTPSGATISIDGKEYGTTPNTISKIMIGEYNLKLNKRGCLDANRKISIIENKKEQINIELITSTHFYLKSKSKYEKNDLTGAMTDIANAIKLDDNLPEYYVMKGNIYNKLEQYENAVSDYNKAIKLNSQNPYYYNYKGNSLFNLSKFKDAISEYDKAIKIDSTKSEFYFNKGDAEFANENYTNSIREYTLAINLDSNIPDYYIERAKAKNKLDKYEDAIIDYNKAIKINSSVSFYYDLRGNVKYNLKKFTDAISDYDIAISLDKTQSRFFYNRGDAKIETEDYKNAVIDLNEAIKLDSEQSDYYFSRGYAKLMLERKDACEDFEIALKLGYKDTENFIKENCK